MDIIPPVKVARFEQLEPGDLFIFMDRVEKSYAIKTQQPRNGDRSQMVLLGPVFPQDVSESAIVGWQPVTTLSFGKNYSILLPTDSKSWSLSRLDQTSVCLAIADGEAYVCTNGAAYARDYFRCFVEVGTGKILERSPPGEIAYTTDWEIAVLSAKHPPRTILKYPLAGTPAQAN